MSTGTVGNSKTFDVFCTDCKMCFLPVRTDEKPSRSAVSAKIFDLLWTDLGSLEIERLLLPN